MISIAIMMLSKIKVFPKPLFSIETVINDGIPNVERPVTQAQIPVAKERSVLNHLFRIIAIGTMVPKPYPIPDIIEDKKYTG